jgi:flagellar basal body-associated protein FliL
VESEAGVLTALESPPFPGLRAFEAEDSLLFFGRDTQTEELLWRLSESRFLAVVGSSGCGKSSLVRAGLLPALFRGYLVNATSRWRCAILRPGTAPIDALAAALAKDGALGPQDSTARRKTLGATSGGLAEVVRQAGLAPGESLLVVVDQFEEIFRFAADGGQGAESQPPLFVSLLLHAVESDAPIYVTLTMRSEYQGDCAQFPGLPEALNRSQYLVPRLPRDQRREVIVRPLELVGTGATPRLVNRLLNDLGDDPDQLPVLQHALLQTYRNWQNAGGKGDVDLPNYEAVGGIALALGRHGDDILEGLTAEARRLAEKIFRSLTTTERGRVVRRPKELAALQAVVSATDEPARARVNAIVSTFARREHSLLMLSSPQLEPSTVVDITHESLMRKWPRLAAWIRDESRSAEWYGDLKRDVVRHRSGDAGLWRDPELSEVRKRRDREGWKEAWARQCWQPGDPDFDEVEKFLDASVEGQAEERRRERALQRRTTFLLSLLLVTILAAVGVIYFLYRRNQRTVADLTNQYLSAQNSYSAAQQEANQARARYQAAALQLSTANPDEKVKLRQELAAIRRDYTDTQSKANAFQLQLSELRRNQDLAASDHNSLLKRIQDLQAKLDAAERDKLRAAQSQSLTDSNPALLKRIEDLQAQLSTVTAERDRLRSEASATSNSRNLPPREVALPTFLVIPQYSVVHLPAAPFGGRVAIGVGDVHRSSSSYVRLYVWTASSRAALPAAFRGDETRSNALLGQIDRPNEDCRPDGPGGRSCYRVQKGDTIQGRQLPGSFTFASARYEIRATGWNTDPDLISLAIYPAP